MVDSQSELEKVAKAYELISANSPPDLNRYLLVCNNRAKNFNKPLHSKLSKKEISDNFLWEKVIDQKKKEIAENILITADKADALSIKQSSEGELYQFKGSNEWLDINDYAETLLHQPFEDQLTHLFRFLLVDEFTNKEDSDENYFSLDSLKDFYFDKEGGFPNKFFFTKALHKGFTLFVWHKKEWFKLDHSKNYEDSISLKGLIDSEILQEKLRDKIYFDGFTQSLAESIYDSVKDFTNPFAEYEEIASTLSLFKDFISFTLILEKLEKLGYKNKDFILELLSEESCMGYIQQAELVLRSWLRRVNKTNLESINLIELINLSGVNNKETLKRLEGIEDKIILAGLSVLIQELDAGRSIPQKAISISENHKEDILGAYKVFLPWWHAVSILASQESNFVEIRNSLEYYFKKTLSSRDQDYSNFLNSCWAGQIQMRLLNQYDCMKLPSLLLDTPVELIEEAEKQKAWNKIDTIITSAYQHKISRSALSVQLSKVINSNRPYLDNASKRLDQLLDLYENNIISS